MRFGDLSERVVTAQHSWVNYVNDKLKFICSRHGVSTDAIQLEEDDKCRMVRAKNVKPDGRYLGGAILVRKVVVRVQFAGVALASCPAHTLEFHFEDGKPRFSHHGSWMSP